MILFHLSMDLFFIVSDFTSVLGVQVAKEEFNGQARIIIVTQVLNKHDLHGRQPY